MIPLMFNGSKTMHERFLARIIAATIACGALSALATTTNVVDATPFIDRAATDCGLQKAIDSISTKAGTP